MLPKSELNHLEVSNFALSEIVAVNIFSVLEASNLTEHPGPTVKYWFSITSTEVPDGILNHKSFNALVPSDKIVSAGDTVTSQLLALLFLIISVPEPSITKSVKALDE